MSMKNNTVNLEKKQYRHLTYDERRRFLFGIPFYNKKLK